MPIYKKEEAKEGGWKQVGAALQKFEGDVVSAESGQWGGKLVDDDGNPVEPREFLEIKVTNVKVLEITEELSMDIEGKDFSWRETCSMNTGSFWVDEFLESADKFKLLLPDDIVGKRIIWEKKTRLANKNRDGSPGDPKFNATNYVIAGIVKSAPKVVKTKVATPVATSMSTTVEEEVVEPIKDDLMQVAIDLAVGKTEAQFRSAIGIDPKFKGNSLVILAKTGTLTKAFLEEGKLITVKDGDKTVYKKP